jgi:hypothetical protein
MFLPIRTVWWAVFGRTPYRFVSNCFSIIQQYFVTGWGGLRSQAVLMRPRPALQTVSLSAKSDEEG